MEGFYQVAEYANGTVFMAVQFALSNEVPSEMPEHSMGSYKLRSKTIYHCNLRVENFATLKLCKLQFSNQEDAWAAKFAHIGKIHGSFVSQEP